MFICYDNCLFNSDNVGFVRVNEKDVIIGLMRENHILKYENEDLAKRLILKFVLLLQKILLLQISLKANLRR